MKNNKRVTELAAERAKDLLSTTFAQEGVLGLDSCQRITFVSPGAAKLLGYCREELEQKKILAIAHANGGGFGGEGVGLLHTSSPEKVCQVFQCQFKKNDGDIVWVEYVSVPVIEDGALAGFTVVFGILPTKGDSKQHFGHIANVDVLTGLPNRYSFLDYVCKALARAKRSQSLLAICFMDLDNFKQVNDSLGHNIGDELLKMIPSILKPSLRDVDYLARLSGDEFGLILENVGSPAEVREVLGRYLNLFNQAIKVKRYEINPT